MPELSIVIVNFNTPAYTAQCLDSLRANAPNVDTEIIVVDNASTDDSVARLTAGYPEITMIRSETNRGIAGGNNLGIRATSGKYVLLLNNDTLVLPNSIDRVVQFLDAHPQAGGVGGQLLNPDGSFQSSHYPFASFGIVLLLTTKLGQLIRPEYPSFGPNGPERAVDWLSTAFMLFRRDALDQVGLVDEGFFIYSDESDLQYRLHKHGWQICYDPDVKTIHFGGRSLTPWKRRRLVYRGYMLYFHKHLGVFQTLLLRLFFAVVSAAKLLFWALVSIAPRTRVRAAAELRSNLDILRMSLAPGIEPV
ncbi:MAG: glycosyltransferase family 2 protein [Chloroflexi bacterium]|nr:glycosyltransferase family 2 protein [Chloroflexota bacterium]